MHSRFWAVLIAVLLTATTAGLSADAAEDTGEAATALAESMDDETVFIDRVQVDGVEGFREDGGAALIGDEEVTYTGIAEEGDALVGIGRPDPQMQTTGTTVAAVTPTINEREDAPIHATGAMDGQEYTWGQNDLGVAVLTGAHPPGTLNLDSSNGQAAGPTTTKNLSRTQVHCRFWHIEAMESYQCVYIYKPTNGDGSSTWNYRFFWRTGSEHAKPGWELHRAIYKQWYGDTAPVKQEVIAWNPSSTAEPTGCNMIHLALNVTLNGFGLSAGTDFKRCDSRYGLERVHENAHWFKWEGEKNSQTWIGMTGGHEFRYPQGSDWDVYWNTRYRLCAPDYSC